MLLLDRSRCHIDCNGAYLRMMGYARERMLGRPVYTFVAGGPIATDAEWKAALARGDFSGEADLVKADGSTVAVSGWIRHPHHDIFLFDRASGDLKQRFADLPNVVSHLAYSSDGRRLAASLGGANGIRVFDAGNGYRLLPSDTRYKDSSFWATFDRAGRLVTTSFDGFVRLYAADKYAAPIAKFESKGHKPLGATFSPDATHIAVSYFDVNDVVVLSGSNLTQLFNADTARIPNIGLFVGFVAVGWSQDGRFLFAGGKWSVNNVQQVRRWSDGGRRAFVDIPTASQTIMQIIALNAGSMLFAAADSFGLINPEAKAIQLQGIGGLGLASGGSGSATVAAGKTASYTLSIGGAGMSGTASLSCTGAPMGATCSVPVSQQFSSTVPTTFSVSVTTTSRTLGALYPPISPPVAWLWAIAALGMVVRPGMRAPKWSVRRYLRLAPLTLLLFLTSCGGGSSSGGPQPNPNGTPAGTYTLTVKASSGSAEETTSLTLTVQ